MTYNKTFKLIILHFLFIIQTLIEILKIITNGSTIIIVLGVLSINTFMRMKEKSII